MLCALTGETPNDPVVLPRSGAIFERKHIERYVASHHADPVSNEPLLLSDLVAIAQVAPIVPPVQARPQSVPSLLAQFQNEWDAVALEMFSLRKQLTQARHELSAALSHQEAAVRVVAKITKERDEARKALQDLAASLGSSPPSSGTIPVDSIAQARESLFQLHKSQKIKGPAPDTRLCSTESPTTKKMCSQVRGTPYHDPSMHRLVLCANDSVHLINLTTMDIIATHENESADGAANVGDDVIVAFPDKILANGVTLPRPKAFHVLSILPHPLLFNFVAVCDEDHRFYFYDTDQGVCVHESEKLETLLCMAFHVDGALLAVGTLLRVQIYSVLDGTLAAELDTEYLTVTSVVFAMNGYWMVVVSCDGERSALQVMDLRKNSTVYTLKLDKLIHAAAIDESSTVIAAQNGSEVQLLRYYKKSKLWQDQEAVVAAEHGAAIKLSVVTLRGEEKLRVVSCDRDGNAALYDFSGVW